jgi:hypothetical protein
MFKMILDDPLHAFPIGIDLLPFIIRVRVSLVHPFYCGLKLKLSVAPPNVLFISKAERETARDCDSHDPQRESRSQPRYTHSFAIYRTDESRR